MISIPMEFGLILAGTLFVLGLIGLMVRRNIIFVLMSIEIMINAAGAAFIFAGAKWGEPDGQIMFLFILAMSAAEVAVGLGLILQIYHKFQTLDGDTVSKMRG
ncbi:MAG: NADH-quinone oxidoreductase subunit NuoK [Caldithrix sp.]|nr:NADH-quinone oxidoreductase subunit NuoK [Caldithrix sp.]